MVDTTGLILKKPSHVNSVMHHMIKTSLFTWGVTSIPGVSLENWNESVHSASWLSWIATKWGGPWWAHIPPDFLGQFHLSMPQNVAR